MLHENFFIDYVIKVGMGLTVLCFVAAISGHMISHHVRRNPDRFRAMTRRQSFGFGIYCTLCVAVPYAIVAIPIMALIFALTQNSR